MIATCGFSWHQPLDHMKADGTRTKRHWEQEECMRRIQKSRPRLVNEGLGGALTDSDEKWEIICPSNYSDRMPPLTPGA